MGIGLAIGAGIAGIATSAYGAHKQANAKKAMADAQNKANNYNAEIYDHNAQLLYKEAEGVLQTGLREEEKYRSYVEGVKGSQRASFGASGAVVDEGSTLDVIKDTAMIGEEDALQIRSNAYNNYKATREQAKNQSKQAKLIRMGGQVQAPSSALAVGSTLLTGASRLASTYGNYAWGA